MWTKQFRKLFIEDRISDSLFLLGRKHIALLLLHFQMDLAGTCLTFASIKELVLRSRLVFGLVQLGCRSFRIDRYCLTFLEQLLSLRFEMLPIAPCSS